jgi:hypothetical protein
MNRQMDHPITAQIARLKTIAKTHGLGDENWIARPDSVVATGNFAAASTSCRNSEGEERDFTMQPLAKSRERAPPQSTAGCMFSSMSVFRAAVNPAHLGRHRMRACSPIYNSRGPSASSPRRRQVRISLELGIRRPPRPGACGARGAPLAPFTRRRTGARRLPQLRSFQAHPLLNSSWQKVPVTHKRRGISRSVARMPRMRQNFDRSGLRSLLGKTPPVGWPMKEARGPCLANLPSD